MGRLSLDQRKEKQAMVEALYLQDPTLSWTEIAKYAQMSRKTVRKFYQELGLVREPKRERLWARKLTPDQEQLIAMRYIAGDDIAITMDDFGINRTMLYEVLKRTGTSLRGAYGPTHNGWRGGRRISPDGYVLIWLPPGHPMRKPDGYAAEHRVIMSDQLGRALESYETVHHINGDRSDNRPENLQIRQSNHGKGVVRQCRCCGSTDIMEMKV